MIFKVTKMLGLDQAVLFSLMLRAWQAVAGIVTLFLIAKFFSPIQQGFFYTFNSIVMLQIFFEMGFAYVLVQFTSHEFAHLQWGYFGRIIGGIKIKRFKALLLKSFRWYVCMAILLFILVFPIGEYFLGLKDTGDLSFHWRLPWMFLVLITALNLILSPLLATIEGSGRVQEVYRLRFIQGFCASWIAWLVIILGGGLYNALAVALTTLLISVFWLSFKNPVLMRMVFSKKVLQLKSIDHLFSWREEIWPMQWRIAISWMSGYFINQLFVPILFYYQNPVIAGQMGMSLTISSMITFIGQAWLNTQAPTLGKLIAKKDWAQLDKTFLSVFLQSSIVVFLACLGFIAGVYIFQNVALFHRLLPPVQITLLVCSAFLNHLINCAAQYLRSHKRDPFMILSVFGAILVAFSAWFFGRYDSSAGVVISLLVINIVYGVPTAGWALFKYRKAWHTI